ncbi:TPA: hypothetical protein VDT97_000756 [Pseudomonas aeruginosa]|nr:hypothetical protein [Pseudomonas aeruginosa]
MRTLGEIIEACRGGETPDVEELRYAVCAMDALMTFDRQAIWKLADAEKEGKKPFLVYSAIWQRDENFDRVKRALAKDPKSYVGWNNDPDNPEFLARRRQSVKLVDSLMKGKQ